MFRHIVICVALAGCSFGDASVRASPPEASWTTSLTVNEAVTCLIPSMGVHYPKGQLFQNPVRFVAHTLSPNKEYDIVQSNDPQISVSGYYVFTVNVRASGSGRTEIRLYRGQIVASWVQKAMVDGILPCIK